MSQSVILTPAGSPSNGVKNSIFIIGDGLAPSIGLTRSVVGDLIHMYLATFEQVVADDKGPRATSAGSTQAVAERCRSSGNPPAPMMDVVQRSFEHEFERRTEWS